MLTALILPIVNALGGHLLDNIEGVFKDYFAAKITRDQLAAEISKALLSAIAEIEKAYADSLAKTFASFMEAAAKSKLMQAVWAAVALSQLFVLLWHQVGIPFYVWAASTPAHVAHYPSSGATVDWAYALVMFCLGGGAVVLKTGPGNSSLADALKRAVGR